MKTKWCALTVVRFSGVNTILAELICSNPRVSRRHAQKRSLVRAGGIPDSRGSLRKSRGYRH